MRKLNILLKSLLIVALVFGIIPAAALAGTVVRTSDFEDGTTQSWTNMGTGVTVANTDEYAASGTKALKITGRTASWHGASLNALATVVSGRTYNISAYVRTTAANSKFTLVANRTPSGQAQVTETISVTPVNTPNTAWVKLQGTYSYTGTASALTLSLQNSAGTTDFYIDDIVIEEVATTVVSPPTVLGTDFEDSTVQNWTANGAANLANTADTANSGSHSLAITGRTSTVDAPQIDFTAGYQPTATYLVTGYVKQAVGATVSNIKLNSKLTPVGSATPTYLTLQTLASVADSAWVKFSAYYRSDVPAYALVFYIENANATNSFYLDDFAVQEVGGAVGTTLPTITGITPAGAKAGESLTINGSNFDATQGTNTITIGGLAAPVTTWSAAAIAVTIPAVAAGNQPVIVTTANGESNSYNYNVAGPAPQITSITPNTGTVAQEVTINGTNFGTTSGAVNFDSNPASIRAWNDNTIVVSVPNGLVNGTSQITVTATAGTSAPTPFEVTGVVATAVPAGHHNTDFEAGTTQNWNLKGNSGTVALTTTETHSGLRALAITGRNEGYSGAFVANTGLLQVGQVYDFSIWAKMAPGQTATNFRLGIRSEVDGNVDFYIINPGVQVTEGGWVELAGTFSPPKELGTSQFFIESITGTTNFLIDDFTSGPKPPEYVVNSDLEVADVTPWTIYGTGTVNKSADTALEGTNSLYVSGRTAYWNGAKLDVKSQLERGGSYKVEVPVKLAGAAAQSTFKVQVRRVTTAGDIFYDTVAVSAANEVNGTGWTTLTGNYTYYTEVSELDLIVIDNLTANSAYYLDNVRITRLSPAPENLPTYTTAAITADFEDGTLQNFISKTGNETATIQEGIGHTGTKSLLISNRSAIYHGTRINTFWNMQIGNTYNVTAWVRLPAGVPTQTLKLGIANTTGNTTNFAVIGNSAPVTDGAWVQLGGQYTLKTAPTNISIFIESSDNTGNFLVDDFQLTVTDFDHGQAAIKDSLADYFHFGAAVEPFQLYGNHGALLKQQFNGLVAENAFKWGQLQPVEGTFNFDNADQIANFAREHNFKLRGHAFLWHSSNPAWLFQDAQGQPLTATPENQALLLQRLQNHIHTVMQRYKDVVYVWDVANEIVVPFTSNGYRDTQWYRILGPNYMDYAFQYAAAENTGAKLYLNDYDTTIPMKKKFLLDLVAGMVQRGVPIDGLGHQMHINVAEPTVADIDTTLKDFAALGIENEITELDVSIYSDSTTKYTKEIPQDLLIKQGYRYKELFEVFKTNKANTRGLTLWGIADDHTWLSTASKLDAPLLFDTTLTAKYAYQGAIGNSLPVLHQAQSSTAGIPTIDGQEEQLWNTGTLQILGNGVRYRTLWDENHLYISVNIPDTTIDAGDKVDIYLDENADFAASYDANDRHFSISRDGTVSGVEAVGTVTETNSGYYVEFLLPFQTDKTTVDTMGFDLRTTDNTTTTSWNDITNSQDTSFVRLGYLTLKPAAAATAAIYGTPVIDGDIDGNWATAPTIPVTKYLLGSGATANVRTMYDNNHLYFLAEVTDDHLAATSANAWEQDSFEFFLDQNFGRTSYYEADDGQFRTNYLNAHTYSGNASSSNFTSATKTTANGYLVEAAITLDAPLTAEQIFGIDFQVNDDNGAGVRTSTAVWNDEAGQGFKNTSNLGILHLTAAPLPPVSGGDATLQALEADKLQHNLKIGDFAIPVISAVYSDSSRYILGNSVTWSTYNPEIVSLDETSGVFTAVGLGTTVATANYNGISTTVTFDVTAAVTDPGTVPGPVNPTEPSEPTPTVPSDNEDDDTPSTDTGNIPTNNSGGNSGGSTGGGSIGGGGSTGGGGSKPAPTPEVPHGPFKNGLIDVQKILQKIQRKAATGTKTVEFPDTNSHWSKREIGLLAALEVLEGYESGKFSPDSSVTRAEFAKIMVSAFEITAHNIGKKFTDTASHWGADDINVLAASGIIDGYEDNTFRPNQTITRAEMATILARVLETVGDLKNLQKFTDVSGHWSQNSLAAVTDLGLMQGRTESEIVPNGNATRAETAAIILRTLQLDSTIKSELQKIN